MNIGMVAVDEQYKSNRKDLGRWRSEEWTKWWYSTIVTLLEIYVPIAG